ncbi:MAG TPA: MBOAT family O-acyltransferase [Rhodocyclaceae bacterium]|nr:MBOAT family O-acyltransferase [Rhodocyclaceae bacterium]
MSFVSLHFLVFVAVLFGLTRACRTRDARNNLLLAASYYFYMCWDWRFAVLILFNSLINFHAARQIATSDDPRRRRFFLAVALAGGLGLLGYFKYANFFIETFAALLHGLGMEADLPLLELMLPIGISFFTFQSLSYTLDVYRRQQPVCPSFRDFALFVAFFPTVLSGPITRAHQILPQIQGEGSDPPERIESGLVLMVRGFVKKVAFADVLGMHLVTPAFSDPSAYSWWFLVVAVYAYSYQIYMDLSGYTDMARGASRLLGFELPTSFNRPYWADSVSSFWQRWHMTMSGFFRDYLFFSLGGSKRGNVYVNLVITFLAIGMWHSAGWKFILYGLIHGSLVALERWARTRRENKGLPPLPTHGLAWAIRVFLVFQVVAFSRILFRAQDLAGALDYLKAIAAGAGGAAPFAPIAVAMLLLAVALHYIPARHTDHWLEVIRRQPAPVWAFGMVAATFGLMALSTGEAPFLYFKF